MLPSFEHRHMLQPFLQNTLVYISLHNWLKEEFNNLKHIITMQITFSFLFMAFHILKKRMMKIENKVL